MTSVFLDQMIAVGDPVSFMIDEMALFTSQYNLFTTNTFVQNIFCKDLFKGTTGGNYPTFQNHKFPSQSNAVNCSYTTGASNLSSMSTAPQPVTCTNGFLDVMGQYFVNTPTSSYIARQGQNIYLNTNGVGGTGTDHLSSTTSSYAYPVASFSVYNSNNSSTANYQHDNYVLLVMTDVVTAHYVNMCAFDTSLPRIFKLQNTNSTDSISSWLQDLCSSIFQNVSPTDELNSFSIYYQNILKQYDILCPGTLYPTAIRNIFAVLMFPYFVFKYIIQNIGEIHATSSQKAPRIFILRRYAIGCAYLFEYFLNKFNILTCPSSSANDSNVSPISSIMRSINDNQKIEDNNDYLTETVTLRQETIQNNSDANYIAGLNYSVIQARNNLQKAITNDIKVIPQVKYSIVYLVFSIVMFCIIVIVCPLLIYFANPGAEGIRKQLMKYMYVFCAVNILWLTISGIIQIIRNL